MGDRVLLAKPYGWQMKYIEQPNAQNDSLCSVKGKIFMEVLWMGS